MCEVPDEALKIIATHHPFDLPVGHSERNLVGRARMAVPRIAQCGADVFLAGHLHHSHIGSTAKRYNLENGKAALVVQAGTTTSIRARGEAQSFNVLDFEHPKLSIRRMEFGSLKIGFEPAEQFHYEQSKNGWGRTSA
jgi:3',5'-cyclic AMP phosphodiesterase CpdA